MANGHTIIIDGPASRSRAHMLVTVAPAGCVLNIQEARRTNDQNSLMWALLSDISRAKPEGRVMPPEIWKCVFMASVGHQCRFEPSLDGSGVVPVGFKSSRLSKAEMGDVIEAIYSYGAEHGVVWSNDERKAA